MAPLCREFGISRVTGYKIFERYKTCGLDGVDDRSRRPHRHANKLPYQVERKSRFALLVKVENRENPTVVRALTKKVRRLPAELRKSLTWDRGGEIAAHKRFSIATDVQVCFCDPRSS
jgi:IS30 family transposase